MVILLCVKKGLKNLIVFNNCGMCIYFIIELGLKLILFIIKTIDLKESDVEMYEKFRE